MPAGPTIKLLLSIFLAEPALAVPGIAVAPPQPPVEDEHREKLALALTRDFGSAAALELLDGYDAGTFSPRTQSAVPNEYIVLWRQSCELPMWVKEARHTHLTHLSMTILHGIRETTLLAALRDRTGCVKLVEQDMEVTKLSTSPQLTQTAPEDVGLPWGIDFLDGKVTATYEPDATGRGVEVYVFDTGVDAGHPWLRERMKKGKAFHKPNVDPQDRDGHGTHCAGTIAGMNVGVAREATIVPVQVLDELGSGYLSWSIEGIDWMMEQKANSPSVPMLASMSLGGGKSTSLNQAVNAATEAGIVVVVAAGNENDDGMNWSPCSADKAICVGALAMDLIRWEQFGPADYSNFGPALSVWAPGSRVLSTFLNGTTKSMSGTSMACPHVSGVVAQIMGKYAAKNMNALEITAHLITKCTKDYGEIKRSTGKVLRTAGQAGKEGNGCFDQLPYESDAPSVGGGRIIFAVLGFCCFRGGSVALV